jgi:toxin ParE1/3/4
MSVFRLAAAAQADIVAALAWTQERFGEVARRRYGLLIAVGLRDIADDPGRPGSADRPELGATVRSYHLRYSRERARGVDGIVRSPRHVLLYRPLEPGLIGIGRVLHDAMEVERHLPADFGEGR